MKPQPLSRMDFANIQLGVCPACNHSKFALGPRAGLARNIVCVHCFREYNVGPAGAIIIAYRCSDTRLEDFFGIVTNPICGHPIV